MKQLIVLTLLTSACSSLGNTYVAPGYQSTSADAVKRITVGAWAPAEQAGAATIIARVAADFVKLRKNYLVPESIVLRGWEDGCKENRDGVLVVRVLQSKIEEQDVDLTVAVELYRCKDGTLLWRAEGEGNGKSNDANLKEMVDNYARDVDPAATQFAAPAFVVLQNVLDALPDVVLSDAEIEEKIELGSRPVYERVRILSASLWII
jgi:probable lipoprotein (TIGR04455 family)